MAFKFAWLCELFDELDRDRHRKLSAASRSANPCHATVIAWFNKYSNRIQRSSKPGVSFLSCLFPEQRSDRVYNIQLSRLSRIFGRGLGLPSARIAQLNDWRQQDGADFASCVQAVMRVAENRTPSPGKEVTLEEIDAILHQIAANSSYSSLDIRKDSNGRSADRLLDPLLKRLHSSEAKWFVKIMLKDLSPVVVPERLVMGQFHFLLPDLLCIQNSFDAALGTLTSSVICKLPPRPGRELETTYRHLAAYEIQPQVGIMIKRQPYDKARTIKHCCKLAGSSILSVERKYDGEYCQVHIDLNKRPNSLQLFSKSGKDSTRDRVRLHGAIRQALQIDTDHCCIKRRCILEGEMVVWSTSQRSIQPFHTIRQHVQHGGRWLGNDADSPARHDEQLMVVFYDVLVVDDIIYMSKPHSERRAALKKLVVESSGLAEIGNRGLVDFSSRHAPDKLRAAFANCITSGWEGLVLKPCNQPYFSWARTTRGIKLKKDYIMGLGDTVDLCLVGGVREPEVEQRLGLGQLSWTSFYMACLENEEEFRRYGVKPSYRIIDVVSEHSISKPNIAMLNELGRLQEVPFTSSTAYMDISISNNVSTPPSQLFKTPFIVEMIGSGFDKPSNVNFFTLRFPRVTKIHQDREVKDVISFEELQHVAASVVSAPTKVDSQEDQHWIQKLRQADGKGVYILDHSQPTTPSKTPRSATTASISPISAVKRGPPLLVRVDTGELSPLERIRRSAAHCSQLSSPMISQSTVTSLKKRKRLPKDLSECVQPTYKRMKVNSITATASKPSSPKGTLSSPAFARDANVPTTPAKDPSSSAQATPNPGQPLSEIPNLHANTKRRLQKAGKSETALANIENNPSPQRTVQLTTSTSTSPEKRARFVAPLWLPTPPSNSAEAPRTAVPKPKSQHCRSRSQVVGPVTLQTETSTAVLPANAQSVNDVEHCSCHSAQHHDSSRVSADAWAHQPEKSLCRTTTAPMLFSNSLREAFNSADRALEHSIRKAHACFTFSPEIFFQQQHETSDANQQNVSVVLVDRDKTNCVAEDILQLGRSLRHHVLTTKQPPSARGRLVFLDQRFLDLCASPDGEELECAEEFFAGALHWCHPENHGVEEDITIRAVWDWKEALGRG